MILMGIFASKLDSHDVRSNWIDRLANTLARASFFTGLPILN